MKFRRSFGATVAAVALSAAAGAGTALAGETLAGGGASFPANMYSVCQALYNSNTAVNVNSDVISYASSKSGTGKSSFQQGTFPWAGTDSAYSSTETKATNFVYVPLIAGAISVMYRLDGVTPAGQPVRLSPTTLGKIFAGQITTWDNAEIKADNTATTTKAVTKVSKGGFVITAAKKAGKVYLSWTASAAALKKYKNKSFSIDKTTSATSTTASSTLNVGTAKVSAKGSRSFKYVAGDLYSVKIGTATIATVGVDNIVSGVTLSLPSTAIRVAYRDGSGTTNNFTHYLNMVNPSLWSKPRNDNFKDAIPTTLPTDGSFSSQASSTNMANFVRDTNGAITYVELSFANDRKSETIRSAAVKNNAGVFVVPTAEAAGSALADAAVDSEGLVTPNYQTAAADAYLINAVSYGLGSKTASTKNVAVRNWFNYVLTNCAPKQASGADYAALSGALLDKAKAQNSLVGAG